MPNCRYLSIQHCMTLLACISYSLLQISQPAFNLSDHILEFYNDLYFTFQMSWLGFTWYPHNSLSRKCSGCCPCCMLTLRIPKLLFSMWAPESFQLEDLSFDAWLVKSLSVTIYVWNLWYSSSTICCENRKPENFLTPMCLISFTKPICSFYFIRTNSINICLDWQFDTI
jgi:hypothetical protein